MARSHNHLINCKPRSEQDIAQLAELSLKEANAIDKLPTPIDDLIKVSKVEEVFNFDQIKAGFFASLKKDVQETSKFIIQKIRGIADLRERAIYIPKTDNPLRNIFPKAHELGHQIIPWHNIDPTYTDNDGTLSPRIEIEFEKEANFFASEVIFQGKRFGNNARDYAASFEAIFKLSDLYGASKFSTIWRYVEEQDELILIAIYYPNENTFDDSGKNVLDLWKIIPSKKCLNKFGQIDMPQRIRTGNPWVVARDLSHICDGKDALKYNSGSSTFYWQAWWNGYTLFVLLKHIPMLGLRNRVF